MPVQAQSKLKQWYQSDTRLAELARSIYRRFLYAIRGFPRVYFVFDDRELIYIELPKVACTSIKATIGQDYGITMTEDKHLGDSPLWHKEIGKLPPHLKGFFKFSFVRDPFSRLVSCYMEKVVNKRQTGEAFRASAFQTLPTSINFEEFVRRTTKIPDRWANHHFKSQYSILFQRGQPLLDWVGRFESLQDDWERLASRFDLNRELESHLVTRGSLYEDHRSFYTKELAELVYKRYRRDFEAFGYTSAYQELLYFISQPR